MRILVTGATGFLGHLVIQQLLNQGHTVFGITHTYKASTIENLFYIPIDFNKATHLDSWMLDLEQIDTVINCVGIFNQSYDKNFANIHTNAPIALFEAAKACHVKKIIQVSALGVDKNIETPYQRTKLAADKHLMKMDLDWIIIRPSWMFGFAGQSTKLFSTLACMPILMLPYQGTVLLQPVAVTDVAQAIAVCATTNLVPAKHIYQVGGPETISFREIMLSLRRYYGIKNSLSFSPPFFLLRLATNLVKKIAPNSFFGTALPQMAHDNITTDQSIWQITGIEPQKFNDILALNPR